MGRIRNSIELAKSSWEVLKADKELLALPVISGIASIIAAATFIIPLFATTDLDEGTMSATGYAWLFLMYVVLAYITIFFNAALVSAAHERLAGGDPTIGSAIRGAMRRAGKILPWAIISATVSMILRAIEERAGFVGQIVAAIAGMAWAVVTFLVLPIIVIEGVGVKGAIKKSGNLFKRTWGENLAAQIGFSLIGFVAVLPAIAVIVLAGSAGGRSTGRRAHRRRGVDHRCFCCLGCVERDLPDGALSLCRRRSGSEQLLQPGRHAVGIPPEGLPRR